MVILFWKNIEKWSVLMENYGTMMEDVRHAMVF